MSFPAPRHRYTFAQYLELEEVAGVRHEFFDGEIYAMTGGTPALAALAVEVSSLLDGQLRGGPCRVFSSDLRVRSLASGLSTYADVTVVCGPLETDPEGKTVVTNPTLVVEITSDATQAYDRGEKLEHYKTIESLRGVLVVSHGEPRLELWSRPAGSDWSRTVAGAGESVELPAPLGCRVPVDDVYRGSLA